MVLPRGFLHFDVRSGLTLPLLNAALFELHEDTNCIDDALKSAGFNATLLVKPLKISLNTQTNFSLNELAKKRPALGTLVLEILEHAKTTSINNEQIAELVALCAQVTFVDPKFISSSKIHISSTAPTMDTLVGLPVVEIDEELLMDDLAIAFLKTVVGTFGARGEHSLLKVGKSQDENGFLNALWCEASLPESMNECGPSNKARFRSSFEVCGLTPASMDMNQLSTSLSLHGATSLSWHLVYGEKGQSFYRLKFLVNSDDKQDAIEAFLIKGEALQVSAKAVEHHELNRRQVFIPMGTGNKTYSMRFWEYLYYDKIVRVSPLKEDLDQYIIKTDYSADVARSDALLAWKKWRGRAFEDK